jgi:plastocyanin
MKKVIRNHGAKMFSGGFLLGVLMLAMLAFSNSNAKTLATREIVLTATDGAFYVVGQSEKPNPVLTRKKGQEVKLVIRNTEPGKVLHCFTITGLKVKTTGSLAAGESETLVFTPKKRGAYAYACLMHPSMSGRLVVE